MLVSNLLFILHCVFIYNFVGLCTNRDQTVNFINFYFVPSQSNLGLLLFWSISVLKAMCWSKVEPSVRSQNKPFSVRVCYSANILLDLMTNTTFGNFWHQFSLMILLCGFLFLCVLCASDFVLRIMLTL